MTIWRLHARSIDGTLHDVMIDADASSTTESLQAELNRQGFRGEPIAIRGKDISSVDTIGQLGLVHGDVIDCGSAYATDTSSQLVDPERLPGLYLTVVSGPAAGSLFPLKPGCWSIGRSEHADIRLADPIMSASHAAVEVATDGSVTIEDLDSTNGTLLEGESILPSTPTLLPAGTFVQLGSSVVTVTEIAADDLAILGDATATAQSRIPTIQAEPDLPLQRRFRQAVEPLPPSLQPPKEPSETEPAKSAWWRSLTPLITGVGFAVMTGRWQFLLIIALAPILYTVDSQRQRKRRAEERLQATATYVTEQESFLKLLTSVRSEERARKRSDAVGGGMGVLFATLRHRRLWERSPEDTDFGQVAIGLASLRSAIDGGDADTIDGQPRVWGLPLTASLPTTGSLGVTGPIDRCRAVMRGLIISLAASHAPSDLQLWILADGENENEWAFSRWLPHTYSGTASNTIALTASDRAGLVKQLRQLIDTRAEASSQPNGTELPIHVVVVDGADLLPGSELTELLARGSTQGVFGLVADAIITPEGVQGLLTLGEASDDGVFESREQPRVEAVITTELDTASAERAARSLAPLRAAGNEGKSGPDGAVQLVDLLGLESFDGADLVERWERMSPQTAAVVGSASDTPMVIDIAEHGPHGLVGGMSGSGKTEFLMTLLTSLCLNNHPDDLGIVIVDFKGGVDHALTSRLPHVVGMSTNLHIEQFKRTIDLLDAEQRRRQELLQGVGGDLDAYRTAREARPELPAIPRLLVIVDEFSELLASEDGKERLQELIRVTRIGRALGVHLLLVTQNFEGQLPPQVEANAGLRVCLRVMKPSHSKVVLDSGIAATIPDTKVGRAFARFHGRDLTEFQTARVAGRRQSLQSGPPAVQVDIVPMNALAQTRVGRREGKPPTEDTDMFGLIEALWIAAEKTGWSGSAVPWPAELSDSVPLGQLIATHPVVPATPQPFPVALQDCPDEQTQSVLELSEADEQVLLLGGPAAGLTDALVTIGTSSAILHSPDHLHLYGLDLDGTGLNRLAELPHSGTIATRDEAIGLKLLEYLNRLVAERRSELVTAGVASVSELASRTGSRPPQVLLLVTGTDRLVRRGEDARSPLLQPLTALLAESVGTGVQILLGGMPSIADSRLGMNVERRFVFQLPGETNATAYGAPKELAASLQQTGRAVDVNRKRLTQFATVGAPNGAAEIEGPTEGVGSDVARRLNERFPSTERIQPPETFTNVSWPLPLASVASIEPPSDFAQPVAVGVDTDSGEMAWIDADEDGPLLVVTGPGRSGRSTALITIGGLAQTNGWLTIAVPGSRRSPVVTSSAFDHVCSMNEMVVLLESIECSQPIMVFLDDAQRLEADDVDLSPLSGDRPSLIVMAGPVDFMDGRSDVRKKLPAHHSGLLLSPANPLDGSAIGISGRLSDEVRSNPRAGRGLLAVAGEFRPVQVPIH